MEQQTRRGRAGLQVARSDTTTPRALRRFARLAIVAVTCVLTLGPGRAAAREWTEDVFEKKAIGRPYMVVSSSDPMQAHTVIGSTRYYQVQKKDTFLDIARYYSLGYNELFEANPGMDPWVPPVGQAIMLPTEWVLPDTPLTGIVMNIPEMRLYYYHPGRETNLISTYPVGLGRDEWRTPRGAFKVRGKTKNPTWVLPESIKKEHIKDGKPAPDFIAGGDPENPLGKYRLELTMNSYGIHGTDIPWGVGMQVSHGCVRLYPEEIEQFFPLVPVGTPGQFVYQPVKIGAREGRIFIQVHKDIYEYVPDMKAEARRLLKERGWSDYVDMDLVDQAVTEQNGVSADVTKEGVRFRPTSAAASQTAAQEPLSPPAAAPVAPKSRAGSEDTSPKAATPAANTKAGASSSSKASAAATAPKSPVKTAPKSASAAAAKSPQRGAKTTTTSKTSQSTTGSKATSTALAKPR